MARSTTDTTPDAPGADDARPTEPGQESTTAVPTDSRRKAAPLKRAFVVQLAADCEPADGRLSGRVQHLETSDGGSFDSVEGLVAILRRVFERIGRTQARD